MMRHYLEDKERIPREQLIDVRYDDMVHQPLDVMERLYARLGYGHFDQQRPRLDAYLHGLRGYRKNSFSALTREETDRIDARWDFAFSALGYATRTVRGPA
jgi:hypothetical protein